ncbi:unnamed protein product [Polarella glacialis]|uniref:Uncharacterized protein n=1 Tax=Polarella glacialis TaxID=89957 RepID=A0A813FKM5_POLGL|nr:unnamed protein product [Polarella glacialis]
MKHHRVDSAALLTSFMRLPWLCITAAARSVWPLGKSYKQRWVLQPQLRTATSEAVGNTSLGLGYATAYSSSVARGGQLRSSQELAFGPLSSQKCPEVGVGVGVSCFTGPAGTAPYSGNHLFEVRGSTPWTAAKEAAERMPCS